jgi:RNA polymerase sigma factor (sigma-70 family)
LLEHAIAELPPGCRRVLLLRVIERLSHQEIADRLGLARSSVEKHLLRAVRLLHAAMRQNLAGQDADVLPLRDRTGTGGRE